MAWWHIPMCIVGLIRLILISTLLVVMVLGYVILSKTVLTHTTEGAYKLRQIYLNIIIPILGIKVEVKGKVPEGVTLFVCNHRTFLDPVIVCNYVRANVIAKAEVANMPFLDTGARLTGVIYVKRDDLKSRKSTREIMVDLLQEGINILVYPEGTTNDKKRTLEYRMGTFKEAATNNFQIVPIAIDYKTKWDMWYKRGLMHQFFLQCSKWRTHVKMEIGNPMRSTDMQYLRDTAEDWTNTTLDKMHQNWSSIFIEEKPSLG